MQELADRLEVLFGPWTPYTPAWTCSVAPAPAVGNGSLAGRYMKVGKLVAFTLTLSTGSTTTYGGAGGVWGLGLPLVSNGSVVAPAVIFLAGFYIGQTWPLDSGTVRVLSPPATAGGVWRDTGPTVPGTWTGGAVLSISGVYDAP